MGWVAVYLPAMEIEPNQLGVVVEHLLEVGNCPALVDAVSVKSLPQLISEAAASHRIQGTLNHPTGVGAPAENLPGQQELQHCALGKLRSSPNSPKVGISVSDQSRLCVG